MIQSLSLGENYCSSCGLPTACNCSSSSSSSSLSSSSARTQQSRRKSSSPSSPATPPSPYFWKRTLNNPIAKRPLKPRGSILTPPKLKLLSAHLEASTPSPPSNLSSDVFIPDLSNLSLGCSSSGSSDLNLRLQQSLQIQSKGSLPTQSALRSYNRRFRTLKWKTRIKCSLLDHPSSSSSSSSQLPTIREVREEDEEEEDYGVGRSGEIAETVESNKVQTHHQSCSQQISSSEDDESVVNDVMIDELASYLENGVYIPKNYHYVPYFL